MKYLKQFVIGSSYLAFIPLVMLLDKYEDHEMVNYDFNKYVLLAPLWWGIWNVISLIMAEHLNLNTNMRFLLISLITSICSPFFPRITGDKIIILLSQCLDNNVSIICSAV